MDDATARRLVAGARVGHLATVTVQGHPHVVPCCFALHGGRVYSAVDAKPKSTLDLRRLENLRANPAAALLVDHYDDSDWTMLWWVRLDGPGRMVTSDAERAQALGLLVAKYSQYDEQPPRGEVIAVDIEHWRSWP